MKEAIALILLKKELKGISEEVVLKAIKRNLTPKVSKIIEDKRFKSNEFKVFKKKVRSELRRQFGAFKNPKVDRAKLLKSKDYDAILKSHLSSKERLPYYGEIYSRIISSPASIIDVGCGFNPLSINYMPYKPKKYLALDINEDDLKIIREYFKIEGITGEAKVFDATDLSGYNFSESFDYCFCFKLFEILETSKSHRLTEEIINRLPSKRIIASFSTRTLGNAPMTKSRRVWFEVMSKRLGYRIESFKVANELFYILVKQ